MTAFPNSQSNPAAAIPVWVVGGYSPAPGSTFIGFEKVASLTSATGLTVPSGATSAVITPEGGSARYRGDGTNPTTSVGMPLYGTAQLVLTGAQMSTFKFINLGSDTATLSVAYYS